MHCICNCIRENHPVGEKCYCSLQSSSKNVSIIDEREQSVCRNHRIQTGELDMVWKSQCLLSIMDLNIYVDKMEGVGRVFTCCCVIVTLLKLMGVASGCFGGEFTLLLFIGVMGSWLLVVGRS